MVEIMLAIGIFAIFTVGITYLSLDTLDRDSTTVLNNEAMLYAQEGLEVTRNIRDRNFLFLINGDHGLSLENGSWTFDLAPEKVDNFYDRTITISDVYRDPNGNINPEGTVYDSDTKKIDSNVSWLQRGVIPRSVTLTEYLSNWRGDDWLGTTCGEFDSGTFDNTETVNMDAPPNDNCGIKLKEIELASDFLAYASIGKHGNDVDVDGNYAYLATEDEKEGLTVIDISDKNNPAIAAVLDIDSKGRNLKKDGDYVYIGAEKHESGVAIVNVSNPPAPSITKKIDLKHSGNQPDIKDNYLYVAEHHNTDSLRVYDITSKTSPVLKTTMDFHDGLHTIKIRGNYAYIGSYDDHTGFRILDISNPLDIKEISSLNVDEEVNAIAISGNLAFLGTEKEKKNMELSVVDISNPASPQLLSSLDVKGEIQDLTISGDYLYAAVDEEKSGLAAINISNPYSPYLAYTIDIGGKARGIDSDGNYIYLSTTTGNKGLVIVGATVLEMNASGTYVSDIFDTGSNSTIYNFIEWATDEVIGGSMKFQIRTADSAENIESATWAGEDGTDATYYQVPRTVIKLSNDSAGSRYFQYMATLESNGVNTPVIKSVRINYTP